MTDYPRGLVRHLLISYQRLAQTTRLAPRGDKLGTRPAPPDEGPLTATARQMADLEQAMQRQPFYRMQITFMNLALGESNWRDLRLRHNGRLPDAAVTWRERVGDWWGITAGEVGKITEETLDALEVELNG